jgi:hypothetical protein
VEELVVYYDGAIVFNDYRIISPIGAIAVRLIFGSLCDRRIIFDESLRYGSLLASWVVGALVSCFLAIH